MKTFYKAKVKNIEKTPRILYWFTVRIYGLKREGVNCLRRIFANF